MTLHINLRMGKFEGIFLKYYENHTWEGIQCSNLSMEEDNGLKSLLKRQEDGEISICLTDKSQKIVVVQREVFLAMGTKHTKDDQEVDIGYVEWCADVMDCHSSVWSKVTGVGTARGQKARVRESYQGGLFAPAEYLLVKDHKPLGPDGFQKTRPVVGGNVGYAVGLTE